MNEGTSRRVSERAFSRGSAVGWYAVDMVEGRTYALDLPREPSASLPVLGIYGPTGQLVADTRRQGQGIGSVCKMAFTPEATGTYYVVADDVSSGVPSVWETRPTRRRQPRCSSTPTALRTARRLRNRRARRAVLSARRSKPGGACLSRAAGLPGR